MSLLAPGLRELRLWLLGLWLLFAGGVAQAQERLEEAPQASVEVQILGNESLLARPLLTSLEFWLEDLRRDPEDAAALEDAAFALEQIYRRAGFPDAVVRTEVRRGRTQWHVDFTVGEGPRRTVRRIQFAGNEIFDDERLTRSFSWEREGILVPGSQVFSEERWQEGLAGIRLLYRLDGYLDARVESTFSERPRGRGERVEVSIRVDIQEGLRTRVRDVVVECDDPTVDPEFTATVRRATGVSPDTPFNLRLPLEVRGRVQTWLGDRGYHGATVAVRAEQATGGLRDLIVHIDPGPQTHLTEIEIVGNAHTKRRWIVARLPFAVGDLYRKSDLEEGRRRLLGSGLFENVTIVAESLPGERARLRVTITVIERDRIKLTGRIGFGSYELGRIGVGIRHGNLFGHAIEGEIQARASFRGEELSLRLRYPLGYSRTVQLGLRGSYRRFEEVSFTNQETLGALEVILEGPAATTLVAGYELRDERILDPDVVLSAEELDDSRTGALFFTVRRDERDSFLDPSTGTRLFLRTDYGSEGLGSSLEFLRVEGELTALHRFAARWVAAVSVRGGFIKALQSDELPLTERFFRGGARSVRSFAEDELGPRDAGNNPVGGEAYLEGSVELRFPIWSELGGAIFYDSGTLTPSYTDFGGGSYRHALGVGLFLRTPIGPLRLDAAVNPRRDSGEDPWTLHFLLGHSF